MSETDEYVLDAIKNWVWSGFYSPVEVDAMIDDILEGDADEPTVRAAVAPEFEKKTAAEAWWPDTTDCDRLDQAFERLKSWSFSCSTLSVDRAHTHCCARDRAAPESRLAHIILCCFTLRLAAE